MDFCLPFGMPGYTALLRKPYGTWPGNDPYGFSFFDSIGSGNIMEFLDNYLPHYNKTRGMGHISIPTGNHDINPRLSKGRTADDIELVFLFLLTMPGVPCIWYGDEIGLCSIDNMVSKEGGYNRTGARTPMQWSDSPNAGFSTASPESLYLPIDPAPDRPTIQQQEMDPGSLLQRVRKLMTIRKTHPALQASANFELLYAKTGLYPLVYKREDDRNTFIIAINPSYRNVSIELPFKSALHVEMIYGSGTMLSLQPGVLKIQLAGVSGGIYHVS
jgi:maltose alpha-D-glucosyltransferase/alpha-amylase